MTGDLLGICLMGLVRDRSGIGLGFKWYTLLCYGSMDYPSDSSAADTLIYKLCCYYSEPLFEGKQDVSFVILKY